MARRSKNTPRRERAAGRGRFWSAALLASPFAVIACVPSGPLAREQSAGPVFDPLVFFAGRTVGRGTLRVVAHRRQPVHVEGSGTVTPDGTMVLDQEVRRGDAPPTHRQWRLRRIGSGRYFGTLTDAIGPVMGIVVGNRLELAFVMKGGLRARQCLYLESGSQVAHNRLVITKLGLPIASLDETITRLPS